MIKCKYEPCKNEALPYPRYEGYCSDRCRDAAYEHELECKLEQAEQERDEAQDRVRELDSKSYNYFTKLRDLCIAVKNDQSNLQEMADMFLDKYKAYRSDY